MPSSYSLLLSASTNAVNVRLAAVAVIAVLVVVLQEEGETGEDISG